MSAWHDGPGFNDPGFFVWGCCVGKVRVELGEGLVCEVIDGKAVTADDYAVLCAQALLGAGFGSASIADAYHLVADSYDEPVTPTAEGAETW